MNKLWKAMQAILRLAAQLRSPLAIAGIVLLALYAILSKVIGTVNFGPLTANRSYDLLHFILEKIFLIALLAIVLSILAYIAPKVVPKSVFAPVPRLDYALAIFRLIGISDDSAADLINRIELFPAFPFFSEESDHPSAWPKRAWNDRNALFKQFESFYFSPGVRAALQSDPSFNPEQAAILGGGYSPEERVLLSYITRARMHLLQLLTNQGGAAVATLLGPSTRMLFEIEQARMEIANHLPNRIAILRFNNAGRIDIPNLGVEFEVAGNVYDCSIIADPEKVLRSTWDYASQRIEFGRLPRGYTVEIRLYYTYQALAERMFPDKINYIQELTQGIRIANITASQTEIRFAPRLISKLEGYERLYLGDARKKDSYDVDLIRLSKKLSKDWAISTEKYDETHPSLKDLPLDDLATLALPQEQIDNIWITFRSPIRAYTAVHVFDHPKGPYVLLTSNDPDKDDFRKVMSEVAAAWRAQISEELKERDDKMRITIPVPDGFTAKTILNACQQLLKVGYDAFRVAEIHYHTD